MEANSNGEERSEIGNIEKKLSRASIFVLVRGIVVQKADYKSG